jgi:hypothetical protein
MNRIQKIAWSMVITISLALIVSGRAVTVLYTGVGFPKAFAGLGFMGIAGLGGFSPLLFRKDKGKVTFDERDETIKRRAALAGFAKSYLFVGLACMIPFSVLGPKTLVSVSWLPQIFGGAAISAFYVTSLAILIQYGRTNKGEMS